MIFKRKNAPAFPDPMIEFMRISSSAGSEFKYEFDNEEKAKKFFEAVKKISLIYKKNIK